MLSKESGNSELCYKTKEPWRIEVDRILEIWLWMRIDFFSFLWFSRFTSRYNTNAWCHDNKRSYWSSPKEKLTKYWWRTCSRCQFTLIPMVNANGMTYAIVVSVPTKSTTDIYNHTLPLIPYVAVVHLTLHGQRCIRYENIFMSCRRGVQDIPRFPCPRCTVMASRTINT
jgi:hypothetical protein